LTVGWPGSVEDERVFRNSFLQQNLQRFLGNLPSTPLPTRTSDTSPETQIENVPAFILGDSAYPNRTHIVTTFKNTDCDRSHDIKMLNAKFAKVRYSLGSTFGIFKGRFRLLNRPLESGKDDITRTAYLITAIFVLHNFLIDEHDDTKIDPVVEPESEVGSESEVGPESEAGSESEAGHNMDSEEDGEGREHNKEAEPLTCDVLLRHIYWLKSDR
jgi:DDE superfamily endonuclease